MAFTNEQLERYSRHIILQEVGVKGQKKLLNASVLIIGAGGLGAPAAMYLAAALRGTFFRYALNLPPPRPTHRTIGRSMPRRYHPYISRPANIRSMARSATRRQ